MTVPDYPAHHLVGTQLKCGWRLVQKLSPGADATGGHFGVGYIAEHQGRKAFVKAIDFVAALRHADPLQQLAALTSHATFERDALAYCGEHRLSKIVKLVAHEYVNLDPSSNPLYQVSCLVLEFGEGDLRGKLTHSTAPPCSWALSVLRDVALAISQLHKKGIAHQDIKPSNVISMPLRGTHDVADMRLGDLGRVVRKDREGPFDTFAWPGDLHYRPPERWYNHRPADWQNEREASDAFMLGSLIFFVFTGTPFQPLLAAQIPVSFRPENWQGTYDEMVIEVLRDAQGKLVRECLTLALPRELRDGVTAAALELTEPDPTKRGDRRARQTVGRLVGVDRFHQRFRELALRASILERRRIQ